MRDKQEKQEVFPKFWNFNRGEYLERYAFQYLDFFVWGIMEIQKIARKTNLEI